MYSKQPGQFVWFSYVFNIFANTSSIALFSFPPFFALAIKRIESSDIFTYIKLSYSIRLSSLIFQFHLSNSTLNLNRVFNLAVNLLILIYLARFLFIFCKVFNFSTKLSLRNKLNSLKYLSKLLKVPFAFFPCADIIVNLNYAQIGG